MKELKEITKEIFTDIVIFTVAEPGAMGAPCLMEFVSKTGDMFCLYYDKIPYASVKECFPALDGCFWNGPLVSETKTTDSEIVVYASSDERNSNATRIPEGFKHVYTGCGNHLLVKKEYFSIFCKYIKDLKQPVEIYCEWEKRLDGFLEEINK